MSTYYEQIYKHTSNAVLTTAAYNTRWNHIDIRIDALERHMADTSNPHEVDAGDVGAALAAHTHTVRETIAAAETSTTLPAGTLNLTPPVMTAGTIVKAKASLVTASSSGAVQVDIQKSGDNGATWASIFTTKLTIDAGEKSSASAATPAVIGTTALSENDLVKFIVDSAGLNASGLVVAIELTRTVSSD